MIEENNKLAKNGTVSYWMGLNEDSDLVFIFFNIKILPKPFKIIY